MLRKILFSYISSISSVIISPRDIFFYSHTFCFTFLFSRFPHPPPCIFLALGFLTHSPPRLSLHVLFFSFLRPHVHTCSYRLPFVWLALCVPLTLSTSLAESHSIFLSMPPLTHRQSHPRLPPPTTTTRFLHQSDCLTTSESFYKFGH